MAQHGKDDAINMLKAWFERDLSRYARWDRDVELVEFAADGTTRIRIYTDVHCFAISARPGWNDRRKALQQGEHYSYLGCIAGTRKPRAGEEHTRGNDLRDGPLTEETWVGILGDIISYEMVRLAKQPGYVIGARGEPVRHPAADAPTHMDDKPAGGTFTPLADTQENRSASAVAETAHASGYLASDH